MRKKYILWISISGAILIAMLIFLLCFFNIPRITYTYDHETDTYYVDTVYGNAKSYTILDEIKGKPVTKIRSRAFMNKSSIETIYLGKNIKEIERLAFLDCKKLKQIDLSGVEVIGRNAFENCSSLEEVHLTLQDILGGTFMGCTNLKIVELNSTLSIGSYAFARTGIETITIPRNCFSVGNDAFYNCLALKKILVLSYDLRYNSYLNSLGITEFQFN
ncbi:MAG: leucine-rich repeat domain-containing protein [Anaeroplasmataceae bacterium]|nr:leucine-rich repeat domain-containing protein [Anaeroplasmataceae bacterium]